MSAQGRGPWQYPVQPRVDPRYVGPRWAAPGPPRAPSPRGGAPQAAPGVHGGYAPRAGHAASPPPGAPRHHGPYAGHAAIARPGHAPRADRAPNAPHGSPASPPIRGAYVPPAPGPVIHPFPPAKARANNHKKGSGCLTAAAVVFSLFAVLGGAVVTIVAIAKPEADQILELPQEQKGNLPAVAPIAGKPDATAQATWTVGTCGDFSKERDRTAYFATRNEGSARVLRGRVAMLHIRLNSPTLRWTKLGEQNVNRAALMSQEFVLTHAKRYAVTGLTFDVIPWSLRSTYQLPDLGTNANHLLDDQTMRLVRDGAREAVEAALSTRLESVVASVKASGYDEVGFVIHLPTKTDARDFAFSAFHGEAKDKTAEMAFIFAPTGAPASDFGHFAVTVTHEGLHLFGADDLYRIEHIDANDQHDIMGEYCTGFRQAIIHDATAYAIGWRTTAPPRGYTFQDR